ncbi:MAG: hypothetical protein LBP89_10505, partial [Helicobacteraceae bacterium]|nr:hypothetical protein [Helicobacteraceae bacterium]
LSVAATYSSFPSFSQSGLNVTARYAIKWYYYVSSEAQAQFETSLLSKGFVSGFKNECEDFNDFHKENAKGSMFACADTNEYGDFNIALGSPDGSHAPTDADLNDVFGEIPGTQYYVERAITVIDDATARNAVSAYKSVLRNAGFVCDSDGCYKYDDGVEYSVWIDQYANTLILYWCIIEQ